jgi:hypothetical protein
MRIKEYSDKNAIELTEDTWKDASFSMKKSLLKEMGVHQSFAKTKTISEMVERGGGFGAKKLLDLNREFLKRNDNLVKIRYKK